MVSSGQKCSACSRAVIHEDVYDQVVNRVEELTKELTVGVPADKMNFIGPVIDQASFDKIMGYIEIGKEEGRLVTGGTGDDSKGFSSNQLYLLTLIQKHVLCKKKSLVQL